MGIIETGWGLDVILWFQSWRTPLIEAASLTFHVLGTSEFYLLVLPLFYWCVDAAWGRHLAVVTTLSLWANSLFKAGFRRPRPFMASSYVRNLVPEMSYGLPSGHVQGSTTLWGTLAADMRRGWVTALTIAYVILIALSRMILGVHYLQDVIFGALVGLVAVGLYARLEPSLAPWLATRRLGMQVGLAVGRSALMLAFHPGLIIPTTPPWLDIPLSPDELLSDSVTPAAGFLGLGVGFALELRYVRFSAQGIWWKRLIRLVIGMAGILALRFGLKALFADLEPVLIFRLLRYMLIGVWASFGAPWLYVRTRLASRQQSDCAGRAI